MTKHNFHFLKHMLLLLRTYEVHQELLSTLDCSKHAHDRILRSHSHNRHRKYFLLHYRFHIFRFQGKYLRHHIHCLPRKCSSKDYGRHSMDKSFQTRFYRKYNRIWILHQQQMVYQPPKALFRLRKHHSHQI